MTALPAITANLKKLDADALGKVIIKVLAESDIQELTKPDGVSVEWLINPKPGDINSPLVKALENTELSIGEFSAWIACEYNVMKKLRQYLKKEKGIERSHLYASSYWKKVAMKSCTKNSSRKMQKQQFNFTLKFTQE